jgi:hypothetical protein
MKTAEGSLRRKRAALLRDLARLSGLLHGSYLERFTTCSRPRCACHDGRKHGPRTYLIVYRQKRQRQLYIRQADRAAVQRGLHQHEMLTHLVRDLTDVNIQLLRAGGLATDAKTVLRRGARHE